MTQAGLRNERGTTDFACRHRGLPKRAILAERLGEECLLHTSKMRLSPSLPRQRRRRSESYQPNSKGLGDTERIDEACLLLVPKVSGPVGQRRRARRLRPKRG